MTKSIKRRIGWAIVVGGALIAFAAAALWLADAYASDAATYCSVNLHFWQWTGCAMAAHEGLAGGLIGAAGALFAGWLAFTAVQEQIDEERRARIDTDTRAVAEKERLEREAKRIAIEALRPLATIAGSALSVVESAIRSQDHNKQYKLACEFQTGGPPKLLDAALGSFILRIVIRDLSADDRVKYLIVIQSLITFVSACKVTEIKVGDGHRRIIELQGSLLLIAEFFKNVEPTLFNVIQNLRVMTQREQ
jgi:hypothetical protein